MCAEIEQPGHGPAAKSKRWSCVTGRIAHVNTGVGYSMGEKVKVNTPDHAAEEACNQQEYQGRERVQTPASPSHVQNHFLQGSFETGFLLRKPGYPHRLYIPSVPHRGWLVWRMVGGAVKRHLQIPDGTKHAVRYRSNLWRWLW